MTGVRARGEDIRCYILDNIEKYPKNISKITAEHFKITRQAVNKHLQRLTAEHALAETGNTRNRAYRLAPLSEWKQTYKMSPTLAEDVVWTNDVRAALEPMSDNVLNIWHYAFTEMFNNAIDHSGGTEITVHIKKTATSTEMLLFDDGVGIFKKIQMAMNLLDERHAILELSKGKLTTDPKNHTGEGIFFTSRMVDSFDILSGGVYFGHEFKETEDWILEAEKLQKGTGVWMKINNHTSRTVRKIFDQYAGGENYGFNKTVVPVKLARYGEENLISRSQAKRLVSRLEQFKIVIFDFTGVTTIGQAFADEIFRVFAMQHPNIELHSMHANSQVKRMVERAKSGGAVEGTTNGTSS